jgi:hypothetical protein
LERPVRGAAASAGELIVGVLLLVTSWWMLASSLARIYPEEQAAKLAEASR